VPEEHHRVLVLCPLSKSGCEPGWRAGYRCARPRRFPTEVTSSVTCARTLGHLPLDALRPSDIHAMNRELVQQHGRSTLSPATIRRIHATLHAALEAAVREDLIAKNPATGIELPTRPHQEPTTWTLEQAIAFLRGLDDADPVHLMFRVMLLRGLRRGETLGLTWADVDFVKRRLRIRQQVTALGGSVQVGPPKSRSSYRQVSLDEDTTKRLLVHRIAQAQLLFAAARAIGPQVLVFRDIEAQPLNPSWVSRQFAQLVAARGLPVIRLHDLRHTSASLGLSAGESLKEISSRLGHSDIEVTADLYAHVQQDLAHESAERLARLLNATATQPSRDLDGGPLRVIPFPAKES
jgi:integrase